MSPSRAFSTSIERKTVVRSSSSFNPEVFSIATSSTLFAMDTLISACESVVRIRAIASSPISTSASSETLATDASYTCGVLLSLLLGKVNETSSPKAAAAIAASINPDRSFTSVVVAKPRRPLSITRSATPSICLSLIDSSFPQRNSIGVVRLHRWNNSAWSTFPSSILSRASITSLLLLRSGFGCVASRPLREGETVHLSRIHRIPRRAFGRPRSCQSTAGFQRDFRSAQHP